MKKIIIDGDFCKVNNKVFTKLCSVLEEIKEDNPGYGVEMIRFKIDTEDVLMFKFVKIN